MPTKTRSGPARTVASLLKEAHSKVICNRVIKLVGNDQKKFNELMTVFLGADPELARRAAWPLSYIVQDDPKLIDKWYPKIIAQLKKPGQHPAIYRNIFRFLEEIAIPKKHCAVVFDLAVKYIVNATQPVAVRAFALTTAGNVCRTYPELAGELRVIVQQMQEETSAAIRVRCRKILEELGTRH